MTARDWIILGTIGVMLVVLAAVLVGGWAAATCEHPTFSRQRAWFKNHRYVIWCRLCTRVIERGRDKTHRAPDNAPGVQRGRRTAA